MKLTTSLSVLLTSGSFLYASSLSVYQDRTFYNFTPKNNHIGFSKGVKAKCEGTTIPLLSTSSCPSNDRLCQILTNLKYSEQKIKTIQENRKVLKQLISVPQPTTLESNTLIEAAKVIGEEQARLINQERLLNEEFQIEQKRFQKQAPSTQALGTEKTCNKEIELTIPYGYLSFSTKYGSYIVNS